MPDINAIRARAAAVPPGPWTWRGDHRDVRLEVDGEPLLVAANMLIGRPPAPYLDGGLSTPVARFLEHARQDVHDLLQALHRPEYPPRGPGSRQAPPETAETPRSIGVDIPRPPVVATMRSVPATRTAGPPAPPPPPAVPAPPAADDDAPLPGPVRTRRVLHRGTKREIARHFEQLAPLTDAQKTAGVERYIEFTPTAVGHKRWRIVVIGPVWTDADVAKTPSEEPGAGWLRNSMRYAA